jgi:tetratricopeptide (TPR) repeat protein
MLSILVAVATADDCENKVSRCNSAFMVKGAGGDIYSQINCYDAITQQDPACPEAWYRKAIALRQLWKYEDALIALNKSIQLDRDNYDYWTMRGDILLEQSNPKEAADAFSEAARIDPSSVDAVESEGWALNGTGKQLDAIAAYDKAIKMLDLSSYEGMQKGIELWNLKGDAYKSINDDAKSKEAYLNAKELEDKKTAAFPPTEPTFAPDMGLTPVGSSSIAPPPSGSNLMQQTLMPANG